MWISRYPARPVFCGDATVLQVPGFCDIVKLMLNYRVFTTGHGGRTLDSIVTQLKDWEIRVVVDVRSQPYSRHQPEFSRETLQRGLAGAGLEYLFMGDQLGGRPADPSCYTENGNVDYGVYRQHALFQQGIRRLLTGCQRGYTLTLLCSEGNPRNCHRSGLIGDALESRGVEVIHLLPDGGVRSQSEVMQSRTNGRMLLPGFGQVSSKPVSRLGGN